MATDTVSGAHDLLPGMPALFDRAVMLVCEPRPKSYRQTRAGRQFLDPETRSYQKKIGSAWADVVPWDRPPSACRFRVEATFWVSGGRNNPDVDNLVKAILDGMTGVVWHDDRQVDEISAGIVRRADGYPKTLMRVIELGPGEEVALVSKPCDQCGTWVSRWPSQFRGVRLFCTERCREAFKHQELRSSPYCSRNHLLTEVGVYTYPNSGKTVCRACRRGRKSSL